MEMERIDRKREGNLEAFFGRSRVDITRCLITQAPTESGQYAEQTEDGAASGLNNIYRVSPDVFI
jgi:hypothetical protein